MVSQTEFTLRPRTRGFHLITDEVVRNLPPLPQTGLLYLFIKHTSAALSINENADPDVRTDMESIFNHLIKEREPYYEHTLEGWDDMPAHAKATIIGVSLTIPIRTEGSARTFRIVHIMTDNPLTGISDIGIRLRKPENQ